MFVLTFSCVAFIPFLIFPNNKYQRLNRFHPLLIYCLSCYVMVCALSWCALSVPSCVNARSHCLHEYGLAFVCTTVWTFRWYNVAKRLLQTVHWAGFSCRCTLRCLVRLGQVIKDFPQRSQVYGRSPVCWRIWFFNVAVDFNTWPHSQHLNRRSTLWLCACFFSIFFVLNALPHVSHTNSFVFKCTTKCSFRPEFRSNILSQCGQLWPLTTPRCWKSKANNK